MTGDLDESPWTDDELDRTLDDLLQLGTADSSPVGWPASIGRPRRRWIAPLAAAASVAAVLAAVMLPSSTGPDSAEVARSLSVRAGIADVGGVRFPVPAGWTVAVTAADDDAVTACVAAAPASPCDGVEIAMAVPDGPALPDSAMGNVVAATCNGGGGGYIQVEMSVPLGGRSGVHYFGGSCSLDGPRSDAWVTQDRSLAISTPADRWATEGAAVAAGLDLSGWPREPGPAFPDQTVASVLPPPTG